MSAAALAAGAQGVVAAGVQGLVLRLVEVPVAALRGSYPVHPRHAPNGMPPRALFVHPDVYPSLMAVAPRLVVSDLFRSPNSSLAAMQKKRGVQPPGWSDHGYGFAFDVAGSESLKLGGFRTRKALDEFLTEHGFPMFWIEPGAKNPGSKSIPVGHPEYNAGLETYHHSFFAGSDLDWLLSARPRSTEASAEARILRHYGRQLAPDDAACAILLAKLGYDPEDDGLEEFQRAMRIATWHGAKRGNGPKYREGQTDPVTKRCLAYCAAEKSIDPAPGAEERAS